MEEQAIVAARASVMIYDDENKKWIHSGTSTGVSKVHIYQHLTQNTFRVVGRKLHDHEVIPSFRFSFLTLWIALEFHYSTFRLLAYRQVTLRATLLIVMYRHVTIAGASSRTGAALAT